MARAARDELTRIDHDFWMGHRVTVIAGVIIGNGAVIGAGAVMTTDVRAYSVVGGVPEWLLLYRFSEPVRQRLNTVKWWRIATGMLPWDAPLYEVADGKFARV